MGVKRIKRENAKLKEARLAIGVVLGFYRRIRRLSQESLRTKAKLTKSSVAMFEAGRRLPSIDAISKLSHALGLNSFQQRQLEMLGEYPRNPGSAGHEWFLPDDVLHGIPLFLRDFKKESEFQSSSQIREMWIVTHKPLAVGGEMYQMLSDRLMSRNTDFVYFLDSGAGEEPFLALWGKLLKESRHHVSDLAPRFRCVLTPASLCLQHFGICNPSEDFGRMFGRLVVYASGVPVGFAAMDIQQVMRAYLLLKPIYQRCKDNPGQEIDTAYGKFRLIDVARRHSVSTSVGQSGSQT